VVLEESEESFALGPGDIIGRSDSAALCVEDPRISEAHALVSLRGQALMLLPLRGRFRVDGKAVTEIALQAGLIVELASGLTLRCESVALPPTLIGIDAPGLPTVCLSSTTSLIASDPPRLVRGYSPDADAVFWTVGPTWYVSSESDRKRKIEVGDRVDVGSLSVSVVPIAVDDVAQARTQQTRVPMRFRLCGEAVRIDRESAPAVVVGGVPGRILAALLRAGEPMHWLALTGEVWAGDRSIESALRKRLDAGIARLRPRLRLLVAEGEELVTLDGSGTIKVSLTEADVVEVPDEVDVPAK